MCSDVPFVVQPHCVLSICLCYKRYSYVGPHSTINDCCYGALAGYSKQCVVGENHHAGLQFWAQGYDDW